MQRSKTGTINESRCYVLTCFQLAALMHGSIGLASTPNVGSKATFSVPFKRPLKRRSSKEILGPVKASLHDTVMLETNYFSDRDARPLRRMSLGLGDGVIVDGIPPELSITTRAHTQVLVVEDNTINQNIAVQIIKKLGFPVQAVWNGKEALEYLANPTATNPRPHIVIMDCQMPM
jgi:CheY-like chemotaxis protein